MEAVCARCSTPMVLTPLGTANAFFCASCRGFFLSHEHAARARAGMDRAAAKTAGQSAAGMPRTDPRSDQGVLACPTCRQPMRPELAGNRRIRIDICSSCGVFFDAHELLDVLQPAPQEPLFLPYDTYRHGSGPRTWWEVAGNVIGAILFNS